MQRISFKDWVKTRTFTSRYAVKPEVAEEFGCVENDVDGYYLYDGGVYINRFLNDDGSLGYRLTVFDESTESSILHPLERKLYDFAVSEELIQQPEEEPKEPRFFRAVQRGKNVTIAINAKRNDFPVDVVHHVFASADELLHYIEEFDTVCEIDASRVIKPAFVRLEERAIDNDVVAFLLHINSQRTFAIESEILESEEPFYCPYDGLEYRPKPYLFTNKND